jgi:hypothetical protein
MKMWRFVGRVGIPVLALAQACASSERATLAQLEGGAAGVHAEASAGTDSDDGAAGMAEAGSAGTASDAAGGAATGCRGLEGVYGITIDGLYGETAWLRLVDGTGSTCRASGALDSRRPHDGSVSFEENQLAAQFLTSFSTAHYSEYELGKVTLDLDAEGKLEGTGSLTRLSAACFYPFSGSSRTMDATIEASTPTGLGSSPAAIWDGALVVTSNRPMPNLAAQLEAPDPLFGDWVTYDDFAARAPFVGDDWTVLQGMTFEVKPREGAVDGFGLPLRPTAVAFSFIDPGPAETSIEFGESGGTCGNDVPCASATPTECSATFRLTWLMDTSQGSFVDVTFYVGDLASVPTDSLEAIPPAGGSVAPEADMPEGSEAGTRVVTYPTGGAQRIAFVASASYYGTDVPGWGLVRAVVR